MARIEKIKEGDLEELALLYYDLVNRKTSKDKMIESFRKMEMNPNHFLLGIKLNNKLIGSVMGIICQDLTGECKPFMVLENVIIQKNYRGQGYGSSLLNEIEKIAKEYNCHYIMLVSNKGRTESHRLYKKHGYDCENNLGFKKYL